MSKRRRKAGADSAEITTVVVLRLYIAGRAPNSVQAIANLDAICREYLKDGHRLEVVDVLEHPDRAMADGVLVSPSLTKLSPLPSANVVGNLSDKAKVLHALGLEGQRMSSPPPAYRCQPWANRHRAGEREARRNAAVA